ncbi:MAG: hypothetical protein IRY90_18430, partial [Actinomadura rubrobrunea]|nr:hypothetical protein [Actinomadura rubrobrunea]
SPKGAPGRIEGRDAVLGFVTAGRAALDVRFEEFRDVVVHETADPEVIVVEYVPAASVEPGGATFASPFIVVPRARDGRIAHWREYQNTAAMAEALSGRSPDQPSSRAKST